VNNFMSFSNSRISAAKASRFVHFGVNVHSVKMHNPLNELNEKYRQQVIFSSELIEFSKGENIFIGKIDRSRYYFLLKGKIKFKIGIFSRKSIDCHDPIALFDISPHLPDDGPVIAEEPGCILSIEADLLDTALAWMRAHIVDAGQDIRPDSEPESCTKKLHELVPVENDDNDWMSLLLHSPLFFNLPPANISKVFTLFERFNVCNGEVIIKQGDEGRYFYVIIEGRAKVLIDGIPAAELGRGDYFGEGAIVTGAPRSASVIMTSDGQIGRLDHDDFQNLLHDTVVKFITPDELGKKILKGMKHCVLLDVRSREEYSNKPSPNSRNIPCGELRQVIPELDGDSTYFISQEGGKRSELAAHLLSQANLKAFVIRDK
jgi:rhodanese-related sulfurtransferase